LTSKNGTQRLQKNTLRPFSGGHPIKVFIMFVGENLLAKTKKIFRQVWGYSGKKLLTPKQLPALTPMG